MNQRNKDFKEGLISSIPIMMGYFPVSMAFGLLAKGTDISLIDSFLFSLMVFAGASQFMAVDLIRAGIQTGDIVLATFLLNLRHLMMSAALSLKIKDTMKSKLLFVAFGVTDETFAVSSTIERKLSVPYLIALHSFSYSSWVCGTVVGYLVGAVLPPALQNSLGIGLYAMYAAIIIPEVKKSSKVLFLAIVSGAVYAIIDWIQILPAGWDLIATIVIASAIGVLFIKEEEQEDESYA